MKSVIFLFEEDLGELYLFKITWGLQGNVSWVRSATVAGGNNQ